MLIGIDLGTTNSLAACWRSKEAVLIPNVLGEFLTPSVVGLADDGSILVGRAARDRLITHPDRTVACVKRLMGTNRAITIGKQKYRPEEISALILQSLKQDAESYLGSPVTDAIISVPAYFRDAQRKATKAAGELAELNVVRLINEPTAAALAHGLENSANHIYVLVFDLGGGTFDVSVLEYFDGVVEVRASAGDSFLGGEDFNETILNFVLNEHKINKSVIQKKNDVFNYLNRQIEIARRQLTEAHKANIRFPFKKETYETIITRNQFQDMSAALLARMRKPVEQALRDSKIRVSELSDIVLVGGATRMPVIRELVTKMFGRFPGHAISPDEAVAIGTGIQSGLYLRDAALNETVLTDVAPYSLGVEVAEIIGQRSIEAGLFDPIIERNTIIPASRSKIYSSIQDNQKHIEINIYQGESRYVTDNIKLGNVLIKIPRGPAGSIPVEVRFSYDPSGILEVDLDNRLEKHKLIIEESPGNLSRQEIKDRLKAMESLKIHPREQIENATVLARAERMYEENLGDVRKLIGQLIVDFRHVLAGQNPMEIEQARQILAGQLDELDSNYLI